MTTLFLTNRVDYNLFMNIKIVNFPVAKDILCNFERILSTLSSSKPEQLIVFPEGALSGYFPNDGFEDLDYTLIDRCLYDLQKHCDVQRISILFGSLIKRGTIFNSAIYIKPYKKLHIYNKVNLATLERNKLSAGSSLKVFKHKDHVMFGVQLCREIKYPQQWQHLAKNGAKVIFHINNAIDDDKEYPIWKSHLISRAAELQRYVVSVNAACIKQKCPTIAIDPTGKVLSEIQSKDLICKDLSLDLSSVSNWYLDQTRYDLFK